MKHTLILAAKSQSNEDTYHTQMLPIRGKPAIAWVIESIEDKQHIVVVLNQDNQKVEKYLESKYPFVQMVKTPFDNQKTQQLSILSSLQTGVEALNSQEDGVLQVILGDTLCQFDAPESKRDFIVVSPDFKDAKRWCLVDMDEQHHAKTFYDKKNVSPEHKKAVVGVYQFSDLPCLRQSLENALDASATELSDVLLRYGLHHPLTCVEARTWFDFGHKSGIIKAQTHFYNARDFNTLSVDSVRGVLTKSSSKIQKLEDEYLWYTQLPDALKVLAPRAIAFNKSKSQARLEMELYGYPALSELFILGNLTFEEWELIILRLFEVQRLFLDYHQPLAPQNFEDLYRHKTWQRAFELGRQNAYWKTLYHHKTLVINGKTYRNISAFKHLLKAEVERLIQSVQVGIMHGDYCFSNILFDPHSFVCRLIDPRGRLSEQSIYGDPRYDVAKLRHSIVGGYDFIVHGLFQLKEDGNRFELTLSCYELQEALTQYFDDLVRQFGYQLRDIQVIEVLLFASMIPLHKDNMPRQKIFYLKTVQLLNQLFEEDVH
jgi:dTDP-glucose pyrophosphorylase